MNTNVALKVNESRLFLALRSAFSSASVLGELMQNARRAGSDWVNFDYNGRDLVIQDGGRGVEDMQTLLTAAESGWDQAIQDSETPFGLGFMATIYSANRVTVMSRIKGAAKGHSFSATTEDLIAGSSFAVEEIEMVEGTVITLSDFTLASLKGTASDEERVRQLEYQLRRVAEGFPIPVYFNGVELPRPHAVDAGFEETEVGFIKLDLDVPSASRLYVQGLPLEEPSWAASRTVVHLNNTFQVKLPDRQHLVNVTADESRITQAKVGLARKMLEKLKGSLSAEEFLRKHADHCAQWGCRDLLDDISIALGEWFVDWEHADPGHEEPYSSKPSLSGVLDRSTIESAGACWLAQIDDMHARVWQAASKRFTLQDNVASILGERHWLTALAEEIGSMNSEGEEEMRVTFGQVVGVGSVDTWGCHRMEVVESITIEHLPSGEAHSVEATFDEGQGILYLVPETLARSHIRLVSDFIDDDRFNESAQYEGGQELQRVHAEIVATDPSTLLSLILGKAMVSAYPRLAGKSFSVAFGEDGRLNAVTEAVSK